MGPHFFKCGKQSKEVWISVWISLLFNGAALFQVRKVQRGLDSLPAVFISSMGPHFFKCGKTSPPFPKNSCGILFNGAALFQVRKAIIAPQPLKFGFVFNGAALFQVRKASELRFGFPFRLDSSMGPHFFKCGKPNRANDRRKNGILLQWGRTFSSAESRRRMQKKQQQAAVFNGAALFQVRKVWSGQTITCSADFSSMGPHFFKCGKSKPLWSAWTAWTALQWGRTFSSAESQGCIAPLQTLAQPLQWGRTFSSAESVRVPFSKPLARHGLQWGRTFSSAERCLLAR